MKIDASDAGSKHTAETLAVIAPKTQNVPSEFITRNITGKEGLQLFRAYRSLHSL